MIAPEKGVAMHDVLTVESFDLTDLDNFANGFPHELFALHRRQAPVRWHEPTEHTPDGEGFWSVATYNEVVEVFLHPETYSSETGGDRPYGGTILQDLPIAGQVLNMMDDPRHNRIRRLVASGLTPRTIRRVVDELTERTRALLAAIPDGEEVDVLVEVAAELPMQMICMLLGVPEEDRHRLFAAVEPGFDFRDGRKSYEPDAASVTAREEMHAYGNALIAAKRAAPTEDMLSIVVHATLEDVDPPTLTDTELYMFFSLLFTAGSETTRNAIAAGLHALLAHPEQLDALRADAALMPGAIEEIMRWTTPSPAKRRTATRDTVLGGQQIRAGDKVMIWEGSANRDEAVFPDPQRFDIRRHPNPHLSFGRGVHFCLGSSLARLELEVVLGELLATFSRIEQTRPIEWTRSNRHTGVRHLHARMWRGGAAAEAGAVGG